MKEKNNGVGIVEPISKPTGLGLEMTSAHETVSAAVWLEHAFHRWRYLGHPGSAVRFSDGDGAGYHDPASIALRNVRDAWFTKANRSTIIHPVTFPLSDI
ncbi:unnamed protein product [marine sediment metagenome]|uniref:Uncharacterized protein n=1 Tax=marine sediment metagenome TaxID=412755 RepID=X0WA91_9ZZZZ